MDADDYEIKRERNKTIGKKVFQEKEKISINDVYEMIDRNALGRRISRSSAKDLFDRIDIANVGKIKSEDFIKLLDEEEGDEQWLNNFFSNINNEMNSKSVLIIKKLKEIKENKNINFDNKTLTDLEWIIGAISGSDIFEPDYEVIANKRKLSQDYLGYLDIFANKRRENDIKAKTKMGFKRDQLRLSPEKQPKKRHSLMTEISEDIMSIDLTHKVSNFSGGSGSKRSSIDQGGKLSEPDVLKITQILGGVGDYDFNIFLLDEYIGKKSLFYVANAIFSEAEIDSLYDADKFKSFLGAIADGYNRDVQYHNDLHAADVLQTSYVIINKGKLKQKLSLQDIDIFAVLLAALCHDFKHPGFNNIYLVNAKAFLAIRYNDASPLENYHVAQSFKLLLKPENNFLSDFTGEEYRLIRRRMIETILATDMAHHGKDLSSLKSKIDIFDIKDGKNVNRMIFEENVAKTYENQQAVLQMCVHCADLSNPAKKEDINTIWVKLVFLEFFNQGDEERKQGLPISLLCDRNTTNIPKSQIGFINFAVKPSYETLMQFTPEIQPYMDVIKENLKRFENIVKEEAEKNKSK